MKNRKEIIGAVQVRATYLNYATKQVVYDEFKLRVSCNHLDEILDRCEVRVGAHHAGFHVVGYTFEFV